MIDAISINQLDLYFDEPIRDDLYWEKRKKTYLIVIDDREPTEDLEYDLYLVDQDKFFTVYSGSDDGRTIIKNTKIFEKVSAPAKKATRFPQKGEGLERVIEQAKNDPIWQRLAQQCYGCGICSYVCPLCYCFEVEDEVSDSSEGCSGCRLRRWDSCLNKDFALTAQGNFREDLADRIYNWHHHKFVRIPREYGHTGCVGCERCVVFCPAGININETLEYLRKKYL